MSNGRGIIIAGILGMAVGVFVGNTMRRGMVSRQMRSTGRNLMRRARGTVEHRLGAWME
ncbi:MAG: hypothetical protein GX331_06380 [Firmicutes bacterium]|nr:hypothetical protein [Bacillota bacterium]